MKKINRRLKTILIFLGVIVVGCYVFLAMTAFNKPENEEVVCRNLKIIISKKGEEINFLDERDIENMLTEKGINPVGLPINSVSVRRIEELLNANSMINKSQCYKTENGNVVLKVNQRVPLLRIKADNGDDYYLDNCGGIIPAIQCSADVIVVTGKINRDYAVDTLKQVGATLANDKFWFHQIVRINVLQDGSIEMTPREGPHIIYFGYPQNMVAKLSALKKFYKYGLSNIGWEKYSYISVEADNQVICRRRNSNK